FPLKLAAIVESKTLQMDTLAREWDVPVYSSVEACLPDRHSGKLQLDVASVCVPTVSHFGTASTLLAAGIDVLVEKPIAASLEEAIELIALAKKRKCIFQGGD